MRKLFMLVLLLSIAAVCFAQGIVDTAMLKPGTPTGWALNYENILMIVYAIGMIVYRIVPTNGKWDWLLWPLKFLDILVPNRSKSGEKHKV